MRLSDLFKKKPKEVAVVDDKRKEKDPNVIIGDDGQPIEIGDKDESEILKNDDNENEPVINPDGSVEPGEMEEKDKEIKFEPGEEDEECGETETVPDLNNGANGIYQFTREELGDIWGNRIVKTKTEDIAAYIQVMENDPVTHRKNWHKVQWFGEDYGNFPINYEDMVSALDPGHYNVRLVDAKKVRDCFANVSVDVGLQISTPDGDSVPSTFGPGSNGSQESITIDNRLKNVETFIVQSGQFLQEIKNSMVQKNDPQQMMNTMMMAMMQKTLEGGNGSDKVIEKIADMMTRTQEMMMGFRTKVEEKKIDFDFEKIRSQNEMELKKMELTMAKGMPTDDEGKKSKNTLQSFIEGLQSFMTTAGPALKEIRKLRELEMGIAPTGDDAGEQETTPE